MNMGMSRMMGSKGRHASMLEAAYAAKMKMHAPDDFENRALKSMGASAKRWANSAEGRVVNVASKKPAPGGDGAKNRAKLDAILNGTAKQTTTEKNSARLAAINSSKPQTAGEKNRAALAALLRD